MKKLKKRVLKAAIDWWGATSELRAQLEEHGPPHTDAPRHECPACRLIDPLEDRVQKTADNLFELVEELVEKTP